VEEDLSWMVPSMAVIHQHFESIVSDSGFILPPPQSQPQVTDSEGLVVYYETIVSSPGATWMKLEFSDAYLGYRRGNGPFLRITSLFDGAVQYLDKVTIQEWYYTTAYFNGDAVKVEIVGPTHIQTRARVAIKGALVGEKVVEDDFSTESICDGEDKREYCTEEKAARYLGSGGCSGGVLNDVHGCFSTAGHCGTNSQGSGTMQFNVPLSSTSGSINHPPPADQFSVDRNSVQMVNGGTGNDWGYLGTFLNSNTDLSAREHVGNYTYRLASQSPPTSNTIAIHIAGHGVCENQYRDNACTSMTYSQVNKNHTHVGEYTLSGTTVRYRADTTGGNSGSLVDVVYNYNQGPSQWIHEMIGIHTHGGCSVTGGQNAGTALQNNGWTNARNNPDGVCRTGPEDTPLRKLMRQELGLSK
jgi:hypothetical protein